MQHENQEILAKLKELRILANQTEIDLEQAGISITYIPKEQLFSNNIRKIITATESLLRQESKEGHCLRLGRDIPDAYKNIEEVRKTPQGKAQTQNFSKLKKQKLDPPKIAFPVLRSELLSLA